MLNRAQRLTMLAALVSFTACTTLHRTGPEDPVIVFTNDSPDQADVYAVSSGAPVRIGTVFSGKTENLRVPQSVIGGSRNVEIIARIFASNHVVRSGSLALNPGDALDVHLQSDERMMSVLPAASSP